MNMASFAADDMLLVPSSAGDVGDVGPLGVVARNGEPLPKAPKSTFFSALNPAGVNDSTSIPKSSFC